MKRLNAGERKTWRRIYGAVVEQGIWRMRNNQELRELYIDLGYAVTYVVDKGCGHDSRWGNWDFSLTKSFRPHYGPVVYSD